MAPTVYSLHKTSTRDFIIKKAGKAWGAHVEVVAEMRFPLPATYKFHKKQNADVQVDLIRVTRED
jgi:rRNA N6-adenosine-methyltransferase METTL5